MKRILCMTAIILVAGTHALAQAPTQQQLDELRRQFEEAKRLHPDAMRGVEMPDYGKLYQDAETFKEDATSGKLEQNARRAGAEGQLRVQQYQQRASKDLEASKPKPNLAHIVASIPQLSEQGIAALAEQVRTAAIHKMSDTALVTKLNQISARKNKAGLGLMLMATGGRLSVANYLIAIAVKDSPSDAWAANALGIVLREQKKLDKSIACFRYAETLAPNEQDFCTNMGWAAAYYGDFGAAKLAFDRALFVLPDFGPALEGKAMIAYQEGDTKALFQCLAKQTKGMASGGGHAKSGPSAQFANFCGGILESETQNGSNLLDNIDNDFPKNNADDNEEDIAVNGVPKINYPDQRLIFLHASSLCREIPDAIIKFQSQYYPQELKRANRRLENLENALPENQHRPNNDYFTASPVKESQKQFALFKPLHILYSQKIERLSQKYTEDMERCLTLCANGNIALRDNYMRELSSCGDDEDCADRVKCRFKPIADGQTVSDVNACGAVWHKYYDQMMNASNDYVERTSFIIKRIRQPQWNAYVNGLREYDIRVSILNMFQEWAAAELTLLATAPCYLIDSEANCPPVTLTLLESGPDPDRVPLKKLKTMADKCYTEPSSFSFGIGTYENNCEHTKLTIGNDAISVAGEKIYNQRFKDEDSYKGGLTLGGKKTVKFEVGDSHINTSAGATLEGQITFYEMFDNQFKPLEKGVEFKAKAGYELHSKVPGFSDSYFDQSRSVEVTGKVSAVKTLDGSWGDVHLSDLDVQRNNGN